MSINPTSELVVDVDASIELAYDSTLTAGERAEVRRHLAYVLARLREPNSQIEPVSRALKRLDDEVALDVQRSVRGATWAAAFAAGAATLVALIPVLQAFMRTGLAR